MRASSQTPTRIFASLAILSSILLAAPARAQDQAQPPSGSEKRIALVVGNADYKAGALATPANDAGLVAQTLQAAGFDVVGARDLDEDSLRKAMRDFTDKAAASGPDTIAFVYLAGYGLQLNGENYFAPVDAQIGSAADVPVQSLRVSDYKRRLAAIPLKARFVVLDAGRNSPFVKSGDPLAGGLALTEADPGSLVAFNAAPGTIGPEEKGPYGAYAQALVEMIREGGLPPDQLFDRVRLRVSETTQGAEVPWNASKLDPGFVFFQRAADAPKLADPDTVSALQTRPLRELGPKEAYSAALKRDNIQCYQEFADAYPREPVTKRVRALVAARRESMTWRRTYEVNTPDAYWSYLSRYPRGPHAYDCRRRLRELSVALEPPARYAALEYDVPPPPLEEIVYVERPAVYFADPVYDLPPPPPPPVVFLPPPPAYILGLAPPPPVYDYYALPVPAFVPLPVYVGAPAWIAPPRNNVYFTNIHNTTVINQINQQNITYSEQRRINPALAAGAGAATGAAVGAAASRVALPPTVQRRAADLGAPPTGTRNPQVDPRRAAALDRGNRPNNADRPDGRSGNRQGNRDQANRDQANRDQALPGQRDGRPLPQREERSGMANRSDDRNDRNDGRAGDRSGRTADRPDRNDNARSSQDERRSGQDDPRQAGRQDGRDRPDARDRDDTRRADRPDSKDRPDARGRDDARQAGRFDPRDRPDARDRDRGGDRPQQAGRGDDPAADRRDGRTDSDDRRGQANVAEQRRLAAEGRRRDASRGNPAEQRNAFQSRQDAGREAAQQRFEGAQRGDAPGGQRQQQLQADRAERQQAAQREQRQMQSDRSERMQAAARQREAGQEQRQQAMQQRAAAQEQRQQAMQQRAAAQQQSQQRQMMQQQQQAQRQQMMQQRQMQQQQQQAQRQQMMMQQRQQAMSRPMPQPHGGGHGCSHGHCR